MIFYFIKNRSRLESQYTIITATTCPLLLIVIALAYYARARSPRVLFTEIIEAKKSHIWESFMEHMKNSENTKFPKKMDLFLSTGLFDEKTLEKIGNGNFGIVFKVKLEKNINLGRNDHIVIKTVAVKDTCQTSF